jgi:hypothetical protein
MKNITYFLTIILFASLTNCGSKDPAPTAPSITLSIDGASKSATISSSILLVETTGNKGRSLGVNALEGSNLLILSISNWDFQNPPADGILVKTYYDNSNPSPNPKSTCIQVNSTALCDNALVTYLIGTDYYSSIGYDGPAYESIIKITANDATAKKISGEYDFKVQSATGTQLTLKGKFDNVSYIKQ